MSVFDHRGFFSDEMSVEVGDLPLHDIAVVGPGLRAIVMIDGRLSQVTDALIGTGMKPLVLVTGQYRLRTAAEGVPVLLDNGQLRTLAPGETLLL